MAEFPALPLWTDAYLADTLDLSTEDHGLYLIMLMLAWRRRDCALPDDMDWLKRSLKGCCAGLHGHSFNSRVPRILQKFWILIDGKWVQKRLQKEFKYLSNISQNNSKAAATRWKNKGLADATAYPTAYAPTPTPTIRKRNFNLDEAEKARNGTAGKQTTQPGVANGEFLAQADSPEYAAWVSYAKSSGQKCFYKYLTVEKAPTAPFTFQSQWPPGFQPNGKAAP
jgi:uncharacterized protein YdaU (DUF1376 family)